MSEHAVQKHAAEFEADTKINPISMKFKLLLRKKSTMAFLLCVPLLVLIFGLIVYPFFYSIWLAMLNKKETTFVGLNNFLFLFKRDTFWMVVRQSILFTLTAVFFKALIGFIMAHLIDFLPENRQRLWRGLALVAWVMPPALSTLGWWWLFEPSYSAINWILKGLFGFSIPWLSETFWARFTLMDFLSCVFPLMGH